MKSFTESVCCRCVSPIRSIACCHLPDIKTYLPEENAVLLAQKENSNTGRKSIAVGSYFNLKRNMNLLSARIKSG